MHVSKMYKLIKHAKKNITHANIGINKIATKYYKCNKNITHAIIDITKNYKCNKNADMQTNT